MVMEDPDAEALSSIEEIEIFDPATIEREVNISNVVILTLGGFVLMSVVAAFLLIPVLALNLMILDPVTMTVYFTPSALIILSFAEIAFIIPPLYYIRKHNQTPESIGLKGFKNPIDIGLGLLVGILMVVANVIITSLIAQALNQPGIAEDDSFALATPLEVILWGITMFTVVGFTEELIFRGFMQKKFEIYFRGKYASYKLVALLVTSFIFAAIHLDLIGLPTRFLLGMFLGFLAQKRNYALLGPTVAHGFNNTMVVILSIFWSP